VNAILRRLKGLLIALVALALSASLTFGAQAPAAGFSVGSAFEAGTTEVNGDEDANEEVDTETDETTDESDSADNCLTDPTGLTPEELAAMSHGSIVCWAAHQTEWPAWFANHGKFVSCWAHQGKADAPSCTEAPAAEATSATHGNGKAKNEGKGKGLANRP
jgi:hypothetical protein